MIGTALLAGARGTGHRRIAPDLARPAATIRRRLRTVRGEHTEWLRAAAVDRLAVLDRDIISTLAPTGTRLGDALNAVGAVTASRLLRPGSCIRRPVGAVRTRDRGDVRPAAISAWSQAAPADRGEPDRGDPTPKWDATVVEP